MTEHLFSYGTLQKETVQKELFGRTLKGERDKLQGYKMITVEIGDDAFLEKGEDKTQRTLVKTGQKEDIVEGMVLRVTEEELFIADQYEPVNYKRLQVTLVSGKQAWIYVAAENAHE